MAKMTRIFTANDYIETLRADLERHLNRIDGSGGVLIYDSIYEEELQNDDIRVELEDGIENVQINSPHIFFPIKEKYANLAFVLLQSDNQFFIKQKASGIIKVSGYLIVDTLDYSYKIELKKGTYKIVLDILDSTEYYKPVNLIAIKM